MGEGYKPTGKKEGAAGPRFSPNPSVAPDSDVRIERWDLRDQVQEKVIYRKKNPTI